MTDRAFTLTIEDDLDCVSVDPKTVLTCLQKWIDAQSKDDEIDDLEEFAEIDEYTNGKHLRDWTIADFKKEFE